MSLSHKLCPSVPLSPAVSVSGRGRVPAQSGQQQVVFGPREAAVPVAAGLAAGADGFCRVSEGEVRVEVQRQRCQQPRNLPRYRGVSSARADDFPSVF